MISKILLVLFSILIFSCSQTEKSKGPRYSQSTLKSFDEIERMEAIERYRKLRQRDWRNYTKNKKSYPKAKKKSQYTKIKRHRRSRTKTRRAAPVLSQKQKDALERELNQNMAYFCMLNRKDKRFTNEADCHAFVENNYYECKRSHGIEISKKLVSCVKTRLR